MPLAFLFRHACLLDEKSGEGYPVSKGGVNRRILYINYDQDTGSKKEIIKRIIEKDIS